MRYGLDEEILDRMSQIFSRHSAVRHVILFGSRAMHTNRPGSDIDLALIGERLSFDEFLYIQNQLDELGYLYAFDVQDINRIQNADLLSHIKRVGKVIYEASTLQPT